MSEESSKRKGTRVRSKKRSRHNEDDVKQRILHLKKERFDKLLYQAKKQLAKQAKLCRTFLLQRHIRKMKKQTIAAPCELQSVKELPLEHIVEQGLRQLGLLHANPDPKATFRQPEPLDPSLKTRVDAVLAHARFRSVLEEWHRKVTDYRRWAMHLDERSEVGIQTKNCPKVSDSTRQHMKHQPTSLFCSLDGDGGTNESPYGPGAFMEAVPTKKNRKGQRARRAKAMAIEAKNEGKKYESLNWRSTEEKSKKRKEEERPSRSSGNYKEGSTNLPTEEQHPSWVAKQGQKSGIVAFKGTKITF